MVVAAIGVLLGIAAVLNLKFSVVVRDLRDYAVGQCSNRSQSSDPQAPLNLVRCDEPHLFEIVGIFQIPLDATTFGEVTAAGLEACLTAFRLEVGSDFRSQGVLAMKYLYWPPETWRDGHTTAACAVYRPDESPLFESVRRR